MSDNVHQPKHYQAGGIEAIDYIAAKLGDGFRDYCIGNVLKYASRYKHKNGDEDLRKASVYLAWAINGNPAVKLDKSPRQELIGERPLATWAEVAAMPEREYTTEDVLATLQLSDDDYKNPAEPPRCATGVCGLD